jgi:type II secretory pathway component PulF
VPECTKEGRPASEGFGRGLSRSFVEIWKVGEETGDLDKSALKLADHYAETGENRLAALARWVPRAVYFIIMIYMAYIIVTVWSGYLSSITAGM